MKIIPLLIVMINIFLVMINYKKAVWFNIFIILVIPLGNITETINTIEILRIGSLSAYEINILILFFLILIKGKIKINKQFMLPILLFLIYIFNIFINFPKYGLNSVLADGKDYVISILVFIIVSQITNENSLDGFTDLVLKALFCGSIIILLLYIYNTGTIIPTRERFGFSVQSLYVFSIPYSLYQNITYGKKRIWINISLFLELYLMIISQNRTNILLIIIILSIMFLYYSFKYRKLNKEIYIRFKVANSMFIMIMICLTIYIYINKDVSWGYLGRINEMLNNNFLTDSTEVRNINISYYINEIKNNILGYGLGKYMPAISIYTNGFSDATLYNYGFDNMALTMSYKLGLGTTLLYILFYVINIIENYKNKKKFLDTILFTTILIAIYVTGGIMTQQLLRNIAVYTFVMTLIVCLKKRMMTV